MLLNIFFIGVFAMLGAWLRFGLGVFLNPLFPTIPLGTLASNLLGGFLIGLFMAFTRSHALVPETARLAIVTGFLGSLTTFSTFSAETMTLFLNHEYFWFFIIIIGHLFGTLLATTAGIFMMRFLLI